MKREHRQIERSAADKLRLKAVRDQFQTERPSLEELASSGQYTEPIKHGVVLDAMQVSHLLKQARQAAQLSLADVSERCGLDRAAISRLENGVYENTTIATLNRLAGAYGKRFVVELVDAE